MNIKRENNKQIGFAEGLFNYFLLPCTMLAFLIGGYLLGIYENDLEQYNLPESQEYEFLVRFGDKKIYSCVLVKDNKESN